MAIQVHNKRTFIFRIVIPILLVFSLFVVSIFLIIIPAWERSLLNGKREMIREITYTAWSILEEFELEVKQGRPIEDVQAEAVSVIRNLRYGAENKDYFWISDNRPYMIVHPYRTELEGTDLSEYMDSAGKRLFVEFARVVEESEEGYVDYMWQWKDDSTRIVPKLSFVKGFDPWGWIIGTGIYIEDVHKEIGNLTRSLVYISIGVLFVLTIILVYLNLQSLSIEKKRRFAESNLKESEAKYRALVEASTEGLVMLLNGQYVYANQTLLNMLGYDGQENKSTDLNTILQESRTGPGDDSFNFENLKTQKPDQEQVETTLITRDGRSINVILTISEIAFGQRTGYTIIFKDVSVHKKVEAELGESKAEYQSLIDNVPIGLFRATLDRKGQFIEANRSAMDMLGFTDRDHLMQANVIDIFHNPAEQKPFTKQLFDEGFVDNITLKIRRADGTTSIISVSAVLVKDTSDKPKYCDGVIEDITERVRHDEEQDHLIVELQTSLRFLNEPVKHFMKKAVLCDMNLPIHKVAGIMTRHRYSAAILTKEDSEIIGLVTDRDLRTRVMAEKKEGNRPAYEIMSSPVISIRSDEPVFRAHLILHEKSIRHLVVRDNDEKVIGMISTEELLKVNRHSSSYLIQEIEAAETVEDLIESRNRLPILVKTLVDSGARAQNITRIITSIFDAITHKLIDFVKADIGEPPARFTFMALGSAGRREQTLISDQDNAIIYEDIADADKEEVSRYFQAFANKICDWLNDVGYVYCKGEAMAKNPKWTQPISQWKDYFHTWITQSDPQDLIDISTFFDFRFIYGDPELTDSLRRYLFETADGQSGFFQHLTKNNLQHRPPVGLLGKIVVESKGDHPETFDIKKATMPLSDFARVYAIKDKISETNTLERLHAMQLKGTISTNTYKELIRAYNFLMQMRFRHHAAQITNELPTDNYIRPDSLTQIDKTTLKHTFSQITSLQKKISYDFMGEAI